MDKGPPREFTRPTVWPWGTPYHGRHLTTNALALRCGLPKPSMSKTLSQKGTPSDCAEPRQRCAQECLEDTLAGRGALPLERTGIIADQGRGSQEVHRNRLKGALGQRTPTSEPGSSQSAWHNALPCAGCFADAISQSHCRGDQGRLAQTRARSYPRTPVETPCLCAGCLADTIPQSHCRGDTSCLSGLGPPADGI